MTPMSPVLDRNPHGLTEIVFAKDQPEYRQLPAIRLDDGTVITRWRLTWRERLRVLWTGSIWLDILTFNRPLQPLRPSVEHPQLVHTCEPEAKCATA